MFIHSEALRVQGPETISTITGEVAQRSERANLIRCPSCRIELDVRQR